MKKAIVAILIVLLAMSSVFAGGADEKKAEDNVTKVGIVIIGNENDQGYSYNFMQGFNAALAQLEAEGYKVQASVKRDVDDQDQAATEDANIALAAEGCEIVFNNSYGFENGMLAVCDQFPNVEFIGMTNCGSQFDDRDNTHNAFAAIYEGRYLAGIVAGMKLNQMIEEGKITADQAVIGYVGAFPFAEVKSGYTAYYLGAKSVCPSVTMKVQFVNSWSDAKGEADCAKALMDLGAVLISQHSDNTTPATAAQERGLFHTGYNADMTGVAPAASILSCRIDWTRYFYTFIKNHIDGVKNPSDWTGTFAEGDVVLTELNTAIAAPGTAEAVAKAEAALKAGTLNVFDTSKFTVNGQHITSSFAIDTDGDWVPDSCEVVWDGVYHESYPEYQSAPYFALDIDGITLLN